MTRDRTAGVLLALAGLCLLTVLAGGDRGWAFMGLLLTLAAGAVLVLGPSRDQRAARRRNPAPQARRIR